MLWNKEEKFAAIPYENEAAIEQAVDDVKDALFGTTHILIPEGQIETQPLALGGFRVTSFQYQKVRLRRQKGDYVFHAREKISIPEGQIESSNGTR